MNENKLIITENNITSEEEKENFVISFPSNYMNREDRRKEQFKRSTQKMGITVRPCHTTKRIRIRDKVYFKFKNN